MSNGEFVVGGGGCSTPSLLLRGRRFYCREWALEKLWRCLEARPTAGPVPGGRPSAVGLLVTGGPGAGKTALCTELVCPTTSSEPPPGAGGLGLASRCLAFHFCQREDLRSMVLWRFVLGLVEQLRSSPLLSRGYREALQSPAVASALEPLHCQKDPDDTFKRAVLLPLLDLPPPSQSLMLVVDSLDTGCGFGAAAGDGGGVTAGGGAQGGSSSAKRSGSIAELLANHQQLLPSWLLLLCSVRRQNKAVCRMFSGFRKLCLDDLRKPAPVRDVQQYILRRLDEEGGLRRQLTPETADMLNLLHIKSGGCFLFLERVLDGVAGALVGLREIRDIPGTLNGLYLWLCQRLFPRGKKGGGGGGLFLRVRPLLNALLAAPRPLTPHELFTAAWTRDSSLGPRDFQTQLQALAPLLVDGPGGSKLLFHASFAEWLTDVKYCTQRYLCSVAEGHGMLAMALTLRGSRLDAEETCQLATHLIGSGVHRENPSLLALWMLWTGVPTLAPLVLSDRAVPPPPRLTSSSSSSSAHHHHHHHHAPSSKPPVLVGQDVLQLLMRSGVFPPTCCPDGGPSVGVHCVVGGGDGTMMRRSLERQDSIRMLLDSGVCVNRVDSADGRTLLASAAHVGSPDVAAFLLSRGADPLAADHQGQTPLTLASRQGHVKVLSVLLDWAKRREEENRPELAAKLLEHADSEGWTALRSAAWGGHGEAVRLLLDAGADVDGRDSGGDTGGDGRTALRAAAWGGHEDILRTLLDYGAAVERSDGEGRTPLIAAAYMGHRDAVEILLDRGAEADLADGDGRTALSVAALCVPTAAGFRGYGEVVALLLERGADPGHRDRDGMTPLLLAAYEGHEDVVELLLEAGADVDETAGASGGAGAAVTPLLAAAAMGHIGTVGRVLFWGAAVDAIDGEGRTALSLAAARGSVEVVRALLDRGLDENHKDDLGWTPLHAAACEGHRAVCGALLTERGSMARVGEMDIEGRTPLILAAQEGRCGTARLLLDRRSPIDHRAYDGHSALSAALLEGHREVAELLMRRGTDTDVRDAEGRPLLYLLVLEGGRTEMAALLAEKGGAPLESRDCEGRTALHVASWLGDSEAVALLLRHGADPDARDAEGRPPLHSVAWRGHVGVGRLLLEARGVDVDGACRQQGATALSVAAQEGHADVVAMLLERGADPDHADRYGRSPVKVAAKRGYFNIVRLLESYGAKPYLGLLSLLPSSSSNNNNPLLSPLRSGGVVVKKSPSFAGSGSNNRGDRGEGTTVSLSAAAGTPPTSTASSTPGSTAERFHSMTSSSSTGNSLATTVQTVPADSLSFTQQIQQHSLPRSRSRHSTLPPPSSSVAGSLHGGGSSRRQYPPKKGGSPPPPVICTLVTAMVHSCEPPQKGGFSSKSPHGGFDYNPAKAHNNSSNRLPSYGGGGGGGKWNSVMASLGVMPGHDLGPSRGPKNNRESPPLGYPYQLQSPALLQGESSWDPGHKKNNILPVPCSVYDLPVSSSPPSSALLPEGSVVVAMTTADPQLNLKQAIKLQFEGPTSAALYKRETPL